jgi:hypothetical protein
MGAEGARELARIAELERENERLRARVVTLEREVEVQSGGADYFAYEAVAWEERAVRWKAVAKEWRFHGPEIESPAEIWRQIRYWRLRTDTRGEVEG